MFHGKATHSCSMPHETGSAPTAESCGRYCVLSENYYFFAGDNLLNSKDSRHFGLIPENFIIGVIRSRDFH